MSLPSLSLICDVCGDAANLGPFPKAYYLPADGEPLPIRWTTGWCVDCGHSRRLEDWPYASQLTDEGSTRLAEAIERKPNRRDGANPSRLRGWLSRIFDMDAYKTTSGQGAPAPESQDWTDLQTYHRLLHVRQSPNRCMHCGGTHVWHWDLEKEEAPEHPGCGGRFGTSGAENGLRISHSGMAVIYDLEGHELGVIQTVGRSRPTRKELLAALKNRQTDWTKAPVNGKSGHLNVKRRNNARARSDSGEPPFIQNDDPNDGPTFVYPWPLLSDFPQTEGGFNDYLVAWIARRRQEPMLGHIPKDAVDAHRASEAHAREMGWREIER